MQEVHAPPFPGTRGARCGAPVESDVLAPPDAHPELQPVEPIEPADALAIHAPSLPAQHDPDSAVPKPRPRLGQLPDPKPERGLIPRTTPPIPRRSTELGQPTGPRAADLKRHVKPSGQLPTTHHRCHPSLRPGLPIHVGRFWQAVSRGGRAAID